MKAERASALNWAIWAFIGISALYVAISIFGTMPALTEGGYAVPVDVKNSGEVVSITMPRIGANWWLLFVPWVVFVWRHLWGLCRHCCDKISAAVFLGMIFGVLYGVVVALIAAKRGTSSAVAVGMLMCLSGGVGLFIAALGFRCGIAFSTALGAFIGATAGTINFAVFVLFFCPNKMEGILLLPEVAITLLLVNLMIIGIVPMVFAIYERLFSKASWVAWGKALHMGVTACLPPASAQETEQKEAT